MKKTAPNEQDYAAFIGIDWGDKKHDVCLKVADSDGLELSVVEHSPEALTVWANDLRRRFGGRPVAVCLETQRGPIVSALLEHDIFVLFPVNPQSLARYRQAWSPSGAKDDPTDAQLALDVLLRHRDKLRPLRRQSASMRALTRLVEDRRRLVQDRVRVTNRLIAALKAYYPQVLGWFDDKDTVVFSDFIARWPTLEQAKRARKGTLASFFHDHNVRKADCIEARITSIKSSIPLTEDSGVILPARLMVESLIPQLKALLVAIEAYDKEIATVSVKLPDLPIFRRFPSAAAVYAPRLLVAFCP